MKHLAIGVFLLVVLLPFTASARENFGEYQTPVPSFIRAKASDPLIRAVHPMGDGAAIVYTSDGVFRTDDSGASWRDITPMLSTGRVVSYVLADGRKEVTVLIGDVPSATFEIARSNDGGESWQRRPIVLENAAYYEVMAAEAKLMRLGPSQLEIEARVSTSSNFDGKAVYRSDDGGKSWVFVSRSIELHREEAAPVASDELGWQIETTGECSGYKVGCMQRTRLRVGGRDVTPAAINALYDQQRQKADEDAAAARFGGFAAAPGGQTRISLNRGFDKCQASTPQNMQIWWDQSFHFDSNIYMSGRNRACPSQPFTNNPAWIDAVTNQGWGLIPTVVGYQSPCTASATTTKLSYDPAVAETQGRGEADIAAADGAAIGITSGSVIYYDMERYDETAATPGCRTATVAFLKGWTQRMHELGYISGVYGSPKNALEDWQQMPAGSRMDAVWMARWDNIPNVWRYASFALPLDVWDNHQRIKQWQAPHNETWGGVTFNIDGNIADGPVAGFPFARNKTADFDGDLSTDISVFRPSTGEWFVYGSKGPTFSARAFGAEGDILTPGDYDGDGKTDLAVFRPNNLTWYFQTKGSFSLRQYGGQGDIPTPADFDGDKRTDIALFRPSTGTWYIAYNDSRNSFGTFEFGVNGDRPAAGDYDGDGKADLAVWRPSDGSWYVQMSGGSGFSVVPWGVDGDAPAQADYDGDGKTDRAVFRPSNSTWYIWGSASGMQMRQFGESGDQPVPGDYDGDGKDDIAVFRPSNNTWYIAGSSAGFNVREFGAAGDQPVPRAYLPR